MIEGSIIPPGQGPSGQEATIVIPMGDPQNPITSDTGESTIPSTGTDGDITPATDQYIQDVPNPQQ
jgi:hypothetical protein